MKRFFIDITLEQREGGSSYGLATHGETARDCNSVLNVREIPAASTRWPMSAMKTLIGTLILSGALSAQPSTSMTQIWASGDVTISTAYATLREAFRGGLSVNHPSKHLLQVYAVNGNPARVPARCEVIYRHKGAVQSMTDKASNVGLFSFEIPDLTVELLSVRVATKAASNE